MPPLRGDSIEGVKMVRETGWVYRRGARVGGGVVILPGAGHLLTEAGDEIAARLLGWIPEVLSGQARPDA